MKPLKLVEVVERLQFIKQQEGIAEQTKQTIDDICLALINKLKDTING